MAADRPHASTPARATATVEVFVDGAARQDPARGSSGAARPTTPTTRRRRSRSSCAPRPGAAAAPASSAPHVAELIGGLLDVNALHRLRSAQGVIGLADKHGAARLDAACRRAIEVGDPTYRTVKGILAAGTETTTVDTPTTPAAPAHLHGPARLFAIDGEVAS